MIWRQPWALLGLLGLAIPVIAHLVARRPGARLVFPTLRFLAHEPLDVRAHRVLADWPLLLLRLAIVAGVAVALAQPLLTTPGRRAAWDARTIVAAVVDTSASTARRAAATADTVRDVARRRASTLTGGAFRGTVIDAADLADGIVRAAAWLAAAPPGRREIVVLTDAQLGSLDDVLMRTRLPDHVGVRIERIPHDDTASSRDAVVSFWRSSDPSREPAGLVDATLTTDDARRDLRIDIRPAAREAPCHAPVRIEVPSDGHDEPPASRTSLDDVTAARLNAAVRAAGIPCAPADVEPRILVRLGATDATTPGDGRPRGAGTDDALAPAMVRRLARVLEHLSSTDASSVSWRRSGAHLVVATREPPTSDAALRLIDAAIIAAADPPLERDPRTHGAEVLDAIARAPGTSPPDAIRNEPTSDARVVWMLVLVLLAAEWRLRARTRREALRAEVSHAA